MAAAASTAVPAVEAGQAAQVSAAARVAVLKERLQRVAWDMLMASPTLEGEKRTVQVSNNFVLECLATLKHGYIPAPLQQEDDKQQSVSLSTGSCDDVTASPAFTKSKKKKKRKGAGKVKKR
mmetsp:Transcript_16236/g.41651  ORF Transcript_16236/g.41651 Transcript_16236/m.41651 type:complete len:122 (-) Transcript_16236:104-469(-)